MRDSIIRGFRLKDLLNILDARTKVSVFTSETKAPVKDCVNVYELLADNEFINSYGKLEVSGLVSFINVTNILITEEV
jgi:hypothetical protein